MDGPEISVLGSGTWPTGGGMGALHEKMRIWIMRADLDRGINHVDTARGNRSSEQTVGKPLRDGYRDKCFLVPKASVDFSNSGL